jgi:hypothetical protein
MRENGLDGGMGSSLFDALNPLRKMVDGRSGWFIYILINLLQERGPFRWVSALQGNWPNRPSIYL